MATPIPSSVPGLTRDRLEILVAEDTVLKRAREQLHKDDPRRREVGNALGRVVGELYAHMSVSQIARRCVIGDFRFLLSADPLVSLAPEPAPRPAKSTPRRAVRSIP